jgi:hypothetical protein
MHPQKKLGFTSVSIAETTLLFVIVRSSLPLAPEPGATQRVSQDALYTR